MTAELVWSDLASRSACSCRQCRAPPPGPPPAPGHGPRPRPGDTGRCPSSGSAGASRPAAPSSSSSAGSEAWWRSSWRRGGPPWTSSFPGTPPWLAPGLGHGPWRGRSDFTEDQELELSHILDSPNRSRLSDHCLFSSGIIGNSFYSRQSALLSPRLAPDIQAAASLDIYIKSVFISHSLSQIPRAGDGHGS